LMNNAAVRRPHIIHALPGRVRIHLPCWPVREPSAIEAKLLQTRGVHRVWTNLLTCNVLIHFDPRSTCPSALADALCELNPDAALTHPSSGGGPRPAGGEDHIRTRQPAACAVAQPTGALECRHGTQSLRRMIPKVDRPLRRARQIGRTAGTLKTALDL